MGPEADELARPRVRVLAWLGLLGVGEFVVGVLALHAFLQHEPQHLSEYALSPFPHVWLAAAASFALAALALTLAMRKCLPRHSRLARLGTALMGIGALGGLALAAFPVDPDPQVSSLSETIHMGVAYPAFGASAAAMLVLVPGLRNRPAWRPFARISLLLGVLTLASAAAYAVTDMRHLPVAALVQRAMASFMALWLAILAVHLLALHRSARLALRRPSVVAEANGDASDARPTRPGRPAPTVASLVLSGAYEVEPDPAVLHATPRRAGPSTGPALRRRGPTMRPAAASAKARAGARRRAA